MISSSTYPIQKINHSAIQKTDDLLAVEEPLEIRLIYYDSQKHKKNLPLSVTMRTPADGEDIELACGFLLTEGIIKQNTDVNKTTQVSEHVIVVELAESIVPDINKLERHFYTSSSCGVCGKTSIEAVMNSCAPAIKNETSLQVSLDLLYHLPGQLRLAQNNFSSTGGLHASGLFNRQGHLIYTREDVGRHNALDKLIGRAMLDELLPLNNHILLLSGRASFELIQKATMAGINFVAAIGAPSSLAVQLAGERQMTLIGFLKDEKFNVYCGDERLILSR